MKNPWLKKNPFLSIWLSGANAVLGSVTGQARAAGQRETKRMMTKSTNEVSEFWRAALSPAKRPVKRKYHR